MPLHIPVIPACRKSVIRLVSVLILPSLVGRIILSVVSSAVYLVFGVTVTVTSTKAVYLFVVRRLWW